jgi:hypothetical protein
MLQPWRTGQAEAESRQRSGGFHVHGLVIPNSSPYSATSSPYYFDFPVKGSNAIVVVCSYGE